MKKRDTNKGIANIRIDEKVRNKIKKYCLKNGSKISDTVESLILKFLEENGK